MVVFIGLLDKIMWEICFQCLWGFFNIGVELGQNWELICLFVLDVDDVFVCLLFDFVDGFFGCVCF